MTMGMRFTEAMVGTWRRAGGDRDLPIRFDVTADTSTLLKPRGTVTGRLAGTLSAGDLVDDASATGTIEVSPLQHRRIRYVLDFADDGGAPYRFDGWKSIDWLRPLSTWTTLPGTVHDADGAVVGSATLRFPLRDTPALAASVRLVRRGAGAPDEAEALQRRRWDGRPGRLEVWYDTITDPDSGTGIWLHHELVAPLPGGGGTPNAAAEPDRAAGIRDGAASAGTGHGSGHARPGVAHVHGWAAVFPADGPPRWSRFGPEPVGPGLVAPGPWFTAGDVVVGPGRRSGTAGDIAWDLRCEDGSAPLYTFPPATWRHELLPGAQVVPAPSASYRGTVDVAGHRVELVAARGATARIYGHGNAERWAWLHADLGDGDVLEVVAAVPRRPGLRRLPPLPMVRLRLGGRDWPPNPLTAAPRLRCHIDLPTWTVTGRVGGRRLHVTVTQPEDRCVRVPYADPDGSPATCTNTERADADVLVERRTAGRWEVEGRWQLRATAHAEVGTRP